MNLRALPLVLFATLMFGADADSLVGEYRNADLQLVIQAAGRDYKGTILFQGAEMPFTARASGELLSGRFVSGNQTFPFELKRDGSAMVLTTQGSTFRLEPAPKINPLAARANTPEQPTSSRDPIVGNWRSPTGTMNFNADGTGIMNGEAFRYRTEAGNVTLTSQQTVIKLAYKISGDSMTLTGPGGTLACTRVVEGKGGGAPAAGGSIAPELVGKWCYVANIYATGGGARSSNRCFTLQADGRYDYYGESDSYGPNGGATSQSGDRGTWTATETSLTARSASGRIVTYTMQKKNHPKNNDPMIVLDGTSFVTFFNKPAWR